ncbi:MAG: hypothetical protein M5U28_49200 [Sandaracinaceae bacterium]|nr:hypothetical protein [Sandaracinaceae bacterium]
MKRIVLALALAFAACGGPSAPPPDEVTETWTSGDDEPLEGPDGE